MSLRPVSNAAGFVESVLAAADLQDARLAGQSYRLAPREIPDSYAHFARTHEQNVEAGRLGGSVRKISAEEIARRAAQAAKAQVAREAREVRDDDIVRRRKLGETTTTISRALGISETLARRVARKRGVSGLPKLPPMVRYGLSRAEFQDWGVIRAKGYSPDEAADIVIRSRRGAR